jgi:hypothetical protein
LARRFRGLKLPPLAQRWHELGPPSARREIVRAIGNCRNSKEALMAIVAGFEVHRAQITVDALDTRAT